MRAGDGEAVQAISDTVHGRYTEPAAVYVERLRLYPAGCFVFEIDGQIAGYLVSHPWHRDHPPALGATVGTIPATADTYYLHDVALLPAARGTGAGTAAVALVMRQAAAAGFADVTLMAINGADRYWAAAGFADVTPESALLAAKKAAYGPDARFMRRPAPPSQATLPPRTIPL